MRPAFPILATLLLFLMLLTIGSAGLTPSDPQTWAVITIFIVGLLIAFLAGDDA